MKIIFAVTLIIFTASFAVSQENKKDYSEAFHLVEVWLEAQKDYEQLPGITALVVEDQKVLWKGGFGLANRETGKKAEPSTIFSICSISKLFTSVAIMTLYDEGKLRLDDKVSDLLPHYELKQKYPDTAPITIRSLLTHSSGLPREAGYPYWTGPDFPFPTKEEVDSKLGEQETLYPASTYFQYSNLGLTLLGEIVEEVSGQSYDDYVSENILQPLGLTNTRTELPEAMYGDQLAIGYSSFNREREREKVNFFQANGIKPAAGFSSTVEDLGKFASWQFRLYDTIVAEVLKPSTLKYMHNVHWIDPDWDTSWGLGFAVRKDNSGGTVVGHGGSCPGYRTTLSIYPKDKKAYVVMINAMGTNPGKYVNGIQGIMDKIDAHTSADSTETENVDLSDYQGHYSEQPWWSEMYVTPWKGKLATLSLPSDSPGESITFLKHLSGDTFQRIRDDGEPGESVTFQRNESGEVVSCKWHENYSVKMEK